MKRDDHRIINVFSRNRNIFLLISKLDIELFINSILIANKSFQLIDISPGNQKSECANYNHGDQDRRGFQYAENDPYRHSFLWLRSVYFFPVLQMDSYMTCSKYERANEHQNISAIYSEQEERNDRKCCTCDRDSQDSPVEILQRLFTLKIPDPPNPIENHA